MKLAVFISLLFSALYLKAEELLPCNDQTSSAIEVIKFEPPIYPTDTQFNGKGEVKFQLLVDKEGKIVNHQIMSSTPAKLFDRSAINAVNKAIFSKIASYEVRCGIISY